MGKYIIFRVGEDEFGVSVSVVAEVVKMKKTLPVPDMPDYIEGLISIRAEVIPVVDMRKRLGLQSSNAKERILVVKLGSDKVGFLVDESKDIADFSAGEIGSPPAIFRGLKGKYLEGIVKKGERVIMLLELQNILSAEEKIRLRKAKDEAKTVEK